MAAPSSVTWQILLQLSHVKTLYRGENFLRSGAENPPSDLSRPGAEQIFLLYIEEKIFCTRARRINLWIYCARARNGYPSLYRGEIFCARARRIHLWIYRARARNRFSSLYRGENFLCSGAENPPLDLPRPGAENPRFFSIWRRK